MDKGEPSLVPEWYKAANGGGTSNASSNSGSSSHSDEHGSGLSSRNRLLVSDRDRNLSSLRRTSSSNGSMSLDKDSSGKSRAYSSFGRSHREREREKDLGCRDRENRSVLVSNGLHDRPDSPIGSRIDKDSLRHTRSMGSGRRTDTWPERAGSNSSNAVLSGGTIIGGVNAALFDRNFPSLGEGKKRLPDVGRFSSARPGTTVQSLPIGASAIIKGGDGWTSALAELPATISGTNGPGLSSALQTTPVSPVFVASSSSTGLNMAEALVQAPSRVRTAPESSVDPQKIEELALRQCKQLIPVTPSSSKTSALNSSDKTKSKGSALSKIGPQSSQFVNHTLRIPARSDTTKTSQAGNLQVLNRERNGISPKDGPSVSKVGNPVGLVPSAANLPLRNPINQKLKVDSKNTALSSTQTVFGEKKLFSQAKDRNDFFNSLRKISSSRSNALPESSSPGPSSSLEKTGEHLTSTNQKTDGHSSNSGLDCSVSNGSCTPGDSDSCEVFKALLPDDGENYPCSDPVVDPEEEAFLQSLGWDKNAGEEALTKEEIEAFVKKYEKQWPASKRAGLTESVGNDIAGTDESRLSTSGSEHEA